MRITCIFSITVNLTYNLTYSPPMTTDLFASGTMYRRREASACPITLSTKQGSHWYHFQRMWNGAAGYRICDLSILKQMLYHLSYRGRTNVALCEIVSFSDMIHTIKRRYLYLKRACRCMSVTFHNYCGRPAPVRMLSK